MQGGFVFTNLRMASVHIGEKIRLRAKELKIGPTELGRRINTSKQNVYGIFHRKSVDSDLLKSISQALQYDFFQYFQSGLTNVVNEDRAAYITENGKLRKEITLLRDQLKEARRENSELRERVKLLQKINKLLESKSGKK